MGCWLKIPFMPLTQNVLRNIFKSFNFQFLHCVPPRNRNKQISFSTLSLQLGTGTIQPVASMLMIKAHHAYAVFLICWGLQYPKNSTWCSQCTVFLQSQRLHGQRAHYIFRFQQHFWLFIIHMVSLKLVLELSSSLVPCLHSGFRISDLLRSFCMCMWRCEEERGWQIRLLRSPVRSGILEPTTCSELYVVRR